MDTADTRRPRRERAADTADQAQVDTPVDGADGEQTAEQQPPAEDAAQPPAGDDTTADAPEAEAAEEQDPLDVVDRWFAGFNDSDLSRNPALWGLIKGRLPELKAAIGAVPTA